MIIIWPASTTTSSSPIPRSPRRRSRCARWPAGGTRFESVWTRSRDWPVTEFELLAGGRPVVPWFPAAEDDPASAIPPGQGLLLMPRPPHFIADAGAYKAWRQAQPLGGETLLDAAHALGLTTALVGQPDFHDLHVAAGKLDVRVPADLTSAAAAVQTLIAQHPRVLALVALGGARSPGPRTAVGAAAELHALASAAAAITQAAPGALVLVTSRGATPTSTISPPTPTASAARATCPSSWSGPTCAPAATGQPGGLLPTSPRRFCSGLGAPATTDFVQGTWATGTPVAGIAQPSPASATAGHALMRAFQLAPSVPSPRAGGTIIRKPWARAQWPARQQPISDFRLQPQRKSETATRRLCAKTAAVLALAVGVALEVTRARMTRGEAALAATVMLAAACSSDGWASNTGAITVQLLGAPAELQQASYLIIPYRMTNDTRNSRFGSVRHFGNHSCGMKTLQLSVTQKVQE